MRAVQLMGGLIVLINAHNLMALASVYNRKEFLVFSKEQLLNYIEQQNDQLARFETRFRDVVKAYKGVLKEKEALESSLHALNSSRSAGTPIRSVLTTKPHDKSLGTVSDSEQETSDGQRSKEEMLTDTDEDIESTNNQVTTLTQALSTLAQEKSKMEQSFQQDKKNLLTHQNTLTRQHSTLREETTQQISQLEHDLIETKDRLAEEKRDRREEEEKFGDMLRELQDMVNKERNTQESLSQELQTVSSQLTSCRQQLTKDRTLEYSETIGSLTKELQRCEQELKETEMKLNKPSPALTRLQEELQNMKQEHANELEIEQHRANEADSRCLLQSQQEEQRVSTIETRLSEMSQIIGEHEGYKERDQLIVQKLRDRLAQLDSENTALTKAQLETSNRISSETVSQITSLQDRVSKLRQLLRVATQKIFEQSSLPNNLEDMTIAEYSDMLTSERARENYQEELSQLRTEFNTYKQRAQSVLKNKNYKEQDSTKELQEKEYRYEEAARMVECLQKEREEEREQHSIELQKLRKEMRDTADTHGHDMIQSEVKHKLKLQDLQLHIQTTRERTKRLLEEKDNEILQLRGEIQTQRERASITSNHSGHSLENSLNSISEVATAASHKSLKLQEPGTTAIQELLDQPSPTTSDVKWFLHAQEQQRVNGEITTLRRRRLELEDNIRDLTERDQRHFEQTTALKMEIRKLERDRSRETENYEYLKNIVLHYMCADSSSRQHLVRPIATVLHFTSSEVSAVEKQLTRGWFSPSK